MFGFLNDIKERRKGKAEYQALLTSFFQKNNKLGEVEKAQLEETIRKYDLKPDDVREIQRAALSSLFRHISDDERITPDERDALQELMTYFKLETKDFDYNQDAFLKYFALALIDKGELPDLKIDGLNIALKKGEIVHWCSPCVLRKKQMVTTHINYSGPVASFRIMKGFRYRIGSVKVERVKAEQMAVIDTGHFWLTNKRVGFDGRKKSFSFTYPQIHRLDVLPEGLQFFKQGKETSYLLSLDDYDVPCTMLSSLMDKDDG